MMKLFFHICGGMINMRIEWQIINQTIDHQSSDTLNHHHQQQLLEWKTIKHYFLIRELFFSPIKEELQNFKQQTTKRE